MKAAVANLKKTTEDIVTILGENTPKDFAARFGQLEKKMAKEARRNKKIEKMLMTIAPRVKWLYHQQFPADDATQNADDAASEDEAEPEEEISDDEDELDYTGRVLEPQLLDRRVLT